MAADCLHSLCRGNVVTKAEVEKAMQDLSPSIKRTLTPIVESALSEMGGGSALQSESVAAASVPTSRSTTSSSTSGAASRRRPSNRATDSTKSHSSKAAAADKGGCLTRSLMALISLTIYIAAGETGPAFKKNTKKSKRESDFKGRGWPSPPDEPKAPENQQLQSQWSEFLTAEVGLALHLI